MHLQKAVHCKVFVILMERLYEPAHVGSLEIVGKVHKKVGYGCRLLEALVFVEHRHRVSYAFYADFLERCFSCVKFVLYIPHVCSETVPCSIVVLVCARSGDSETSSE